MTAVSPLAAPPPAGERPRFSIGPLAMAIELAALEAWLDAAAPGDQIIYASGPALPRSADAVVRVRALIEARRVTAFTARRGGITDFIAQRRADPVRVAAGDGAIGGAVAGVGADNQAAVLRMIRRAINLGKPCPTNAEIAAACGLPNADAASYLFRKLVRDGVIISTDHGPRMRRVVRVAGGGKSTPEAPL